LIVVCGSEPEGRCTFLKYYCFQTYGFSDFITPGQTMKVIGYDNMCNLVLTLEKIKDKHPKLKELAEKVVKVVDKFHFRGHTGSFCRRTVNPHMWPELAAANMSIAEQSFRNSNRLRRSFRYMNRETFGFMLQDVCFLQQRVRNLGFVNVAVAQEDAAAEEEFAVMGQQNMVVKAAEAVVAMLASRNGIAG